MFWEQRSEPSVYKYTKLSPSFFKEAICLQTHQIKSTIFETIHEIRYYSEGKNSILEGRKEYTEESDLPLFNIFFTMV
jgi:hypothetical protein